MAVPSGLGSDPDRLAGLNQAKLRGLVAANFDVAADALEPVSFNGGAGLSHDGAAYLYLNEPTTSALGATLAWGSNRGIDNLHLLVDDDGDLMARQAQGLDPRPTVWITDGTSLVAAVPGPYPDHEVPPAVELFRRVFLEAGAEVVQQGTDLVAEVHGLEVGRAVTDGKGGADARVGVGVFDQEAHAMISGVEVLERLPAVIDEVRAGRVAGASSQMLNRLARERWLRRVIELQPALVDADPDRPLDPVSELEPRKGIQLTHPVALRGHTTAGASLLVVCSVGIDLDLVPVAADHLAHTPADQVVLALPERDVHHIVTSMAAFLAAPTTVLGIPVPWG